MRKILIATPAYSAQVYQHTIISVDLAKEEGAGRGWEVRWLPVIGTADIADVRNQILGLFLKTQCDDLLLLDADNSFGPKNFTYIMEHKAEFVAGLYRERTDDRVHYPGEPTSPREMIMDEASGRPLLKMNYVPGGFMRLQRSVIETMAALKSTRWVRDPNKIKGIRYPFLFDWTWVINESDDGSQWQRLSEDNTFCRRWRDMGGSVFADPSLKINHTGIKVFAGDFMAMLEGNLEIEAGDATSTAKAALALAG